jgi:hypothetical protein
MWARSPLATQPWYSAKKKKISLVAIAIGCGCSWTYVLPRTTLAQYGTALEERWLEGNVVESCCWVPASLVAQPAIPEVGKAERIGQQAVSLFPGQLLVLSSPGQGEVRGCGRGVRWWLYLMSSRLDQHPPSRGGVAVQQYCPRHIECVWQKPVSAAAKPLRSVSPLCRRVFSAQDGARQKLKICPELSGNRLSDSVFKNSVHYL